MIVVFGSINIDLVTRVERIAGPGETVMGNAYTAIPGGKGANQALAARRAGASVAMVGAVGRDGFAAEALGLLREAGIDLANVADTDAPTGAAFIAVNAGGDNAITVAAGANADAKADALGALGLGTGDTLLLQREVPDTESEAAALHARRRGARTVLNLAPSGLIPARYLEALDVLVVNEHEAADLAYALHRPAELPDLAAHLREAYGLATLVVTLGAEGAIGWQDGIEHRATSPKVAAVDTTAAGDSFVGAFAAALDAGLAFPEALRRGTAAGSLACTTRGAQPSIPTKAAIDALIGV